jgi:toxin ParE1/3/4
MPESRVELHPDAVAEAAAARQWYEARSPNAAASFLSELEHAIRQAAAMPSSWPAHLHGTRRVLLRRFPYLVVYRQIESGVQIVAVAHGRRRPGYWKTR